MLRFDGKTFVLSDFDLGGRDVERAEVKVVVSKSEASRSLCYQKFGNVNVVNGVIRRQARDGSGVPARCSF